MNLEQIEITMHVYLAKGEEPDFSLSNWIKIYGALHAFNKIIDEYINSTAFDKFEHNVGEILVDLERGLNIEEIET